MKVLFVFNHPAPYKVRTYNELAKKLDIFVIFERNKAKDRPDSFYNCNEYNFPHLILKRGYFGKENSNTGELVKYLKQHHQEHDLIVMNGYSKLTEMRAIRYLIKHNIPYILQINGGIVHKESNLKRKFKTYFISHAYKYLSTGTEGDKYLKYYGAEQKDIYFYPYSTLEEKEILSEPVTKEAKEKIRKEFDLPESPLYVTASQFIPRKNVSYLIRLFKQIKGNLIVVGEGEEKKLYEEIIEKEQINNVKLRSFLKKDDLYRLLQGCDAFVTLSKEDIYGHSTLEALASGLPVISSVNVASSNQIITNSENGYLVHLDNEQEILESFEKILKIDNTNCLKSAKTFTIENSSKEIFQILKDIKK